MKGDIKLNTGNESIKLGNINDIKSEYGIHEIKDGELQIIGAPPDKKDIYNKAQHIFNGDLFLEIMYEDKNLDDILYIINSGDFIINNKYGEFKYKPLSEPKVDKELHKIVVEVERI